MTPHWLPEDACEPARDWLASLPTDTTPQQIVDQCPYVGWLLWLAEAWRLDVTLHLRGVVLRTVRVHAAAGLRFSGLPELAETLAAVPDDIELPALLAVLRQAEAVAGESAWASADDRAGLTEDAAFTAYRRAWVGAWTLTRATLAVTYLSEYQDTHSVYITGYGADAAVRATGEMAGPEWAAERQQQLEDARKMLGPALIRRAGEVGRR